MQNGSIYFILTLFGIAQAQRSSKLFGEFRGDRGDNWYFRDFVSTIQITSLTSECAHPKDVYSCYGKWVSERTIAMTVTDKCHPANLPKTGLWQFHWFPGESKIRERADSQTIAWYQQQSDAEDIIGDYSVNSADSAQIIGTNQPNQPDYNILYHMSYWPGHTDKYKHGQYVNQFSGSNDIMYVNGYLHDLVNMPFHFNVDDGMLKSYGSQNPNPGTPAAKTWKLKTKHEFSKSNQYDKKDNFIKEVIGYKANIWVKRDGENGKYGTLTYDDKGSRTGYVKFDDGTKWFLIYYRNTKHIQWIYDKCYDGKWREVWKDPQPVDPIIRPPTKDPTNSPTQSPTAAPTQSPTHAPTRSPTQPPTAAPTKSPTSAPTKSPTSAPTAAPTRAPTHAPTQSPTAAPSVSPSAAPTSSPSSAPTPSPIDDMHGYSHKMPLIQAVIIAIFMFALGCCQIEIVWYYCVDKPAQLKKERRRERRNARRNRRKKQRDDDYEDDNESAFLLEGGKKQNESKNICIAANEKSKKKI